MIEKKFIILINRYLDNEISQEEKNNLDEFLNRNEEGAKYFNEMTKISSYLNLDEKAIPSANIKKNILNTIDYSKYIKPVKTSYLEKVSEIFRKIDKKMVLAFSSGVAAVVLFFIMIGYPNIEIENTNSITGTFVNNNALSNLKSNEYILHKEQVDGKIYEYYNDEIISIDFEFNSQEINQILVNFNSDYLKFSQITNNDVQNFKFDLESNKVLIETSGKSDFSLEFNKKDKPIPQNCISLTLNEEKLKKK